MSQPKTIEGRELTKFVESPKRPNNSAIETIVSNEQAIPVEFGFNGEQISIYNEALSVAGQSSVSIVSYTVPLNKRFILSRVNISGDNRGVYTLDVNASEVGKIRTYYTNFNATLKFDDISYSQGDIISVLVENKSNMIGDFNANIQGNLRDA